MSVDRYEVVIGCEIHCQLLTKTKAFCACENRYGGMPDTRVCPVCLGLPGAMPRVSKGYVELGAVAGLALNCNIARFTKFDRKHYFYPDLAKGYQITQYDIPLCSDGYVDLPFKHLPKEQQPGGEKYRGTNFIGENCNINDTYRRVRVERIHLEEDVGKSLHLEGAHSYIDYNRCGTPLIEIVTKPDMASPEEAALFLQTVQEILRYVGVTKGNLEEGNMRCDANINQYGKMVKSITLRFPKSKTLTLSGQSEMPVHMKFNGNYINLKQTDRSLTPVTKTPWAGMKQKGKQLFSVQRTPL